MAYILNAGYRRLYGPYNAYNLHSQRALHIRIKYSHTHLTRNICILVTRSYSWRCEKKNIRGLKFNKLTKDKILYLELDKDLFEISFEKQHPDHKVSEKPDWYIFNKKTKKIIIGMNQVALWGGGAQDNRGSKYLKDNKFNTKDTKLLCVVSAFVEIKSKNKTFELFEIGIKNKTLCYLTNLGNIINDFFSQDNI